MKIILYKRNNFINSSGGAEHVLCNFANHLAAKGYEVLLVTRDTQKGLPFYRLDERVRLVNLSAKIPGFGLVRRSINKVLMSLPGGEKLLSRLNCFNREAVISGVMQEFFRAEKPDLVVAAGVPDLADLIYGEKYSCPFVLMIHSLPSVYYEKAEKCKLKMFLEVTAKADAVQVLLPSYVEIMRKYYRGRVEVIGNAVAESEGKAEHGNDKDSYTIIYMARFDSNKRQDLLVKAFVRLSERFPQWNVKLWGQGRQREKDKIAALISKHKLQNQVLMCGVTNQAEDELLKADICAFPSAFEGFPLALTEAMSAGLPCVGLKTASGVNALITEGKNGFLTDDNPQAFAEALEKLMENVSLRRSMGEAAVEIMSAYRPEVIWRHWDDFILSLMRSGR